MALEAPLRSSTGSIISAFSPHTEFSMSSPESTAAPHSQFRPMSTGFLDSHSLRPSPATRPASANNLLLSPSDVVGPSPVTSVGTEVTEIEDEVSDEVRPQTTAAHPGPQPQLLMLSTNLPDQVRQTATEEAVSVIHAPETFKSWTSTKSSPKESESTQRMSSRSSSSSPPSKPKDIVVPQADDHATKAALPTPPPLSTDVKPVRFSIDSATPRAQSLPEVLSDSSRIRSSSASSLELIPESREPDTDAEPDLESYDDDEEFVTPVREQDGGEDVEIKELKTALQECWTLCNTLANLSTHHRERVFSTSGTPDGHERAWKCCWKLCQRLYDNRDEIDESFNVRQNLDLCRDFCQSLFDVRQRKEESADSVLRVSFELNNHLYSAQDNRNLPEAFRERTLDFYITLCHRLMKQRERSTSPSSLSHPPTSSSLYDRHHPRTGDETDGLLSACWTLAEMLFSLRQSRRGGRSPDADLLGSAVQACWELCDIFRAGWHQIPRPENRGTPRPNQTNFFAGAGSGASAAGAVVVVPPSASSVSASATDSSVADGRESRASARSVKSSRKQQQPLPVPETPVTEFEDTPVSPDGESPLPNILVLGTGSTDGGGRGGGGGGGGGGGRWSSSASNMSGYSQSSQRTSSTATTTAAAAGEDVHVTRVKMLLLKAAMKVGFARDGDASLPAFVKGLPAGSFGSLPAHAALLQSYRALVLGDPAFRQPASLPPRGRRVAAADVAKSVAWAAHRLGGQYAFLRDLFRLVFGFPVDEADGRKNVSIAV
ncbi:hypothetical protein GGR52DRAFT_569827 [Hypoxylon sp. FL1284]|nr:hypothetical protein GGR52DRAFT_569827 [Hypoxylon sp. FL1284]